MKTDSIPEDLKEPQLSPSEPSPSEVREEANEGQKAEEATPVEEAPAQAAEAPVEEAPAQEASPSEEGEKTKKHRKKRRKKLTEITEFNDIRYSPPLSYRHLRIIGWFFMAFTPLAFVFAAGGKVDMIPANVAEILNPIATSIASLAMPLFLLANYSFIFRSRKAYKGLITFYAGMTIIMALLYYLVVYRYLSLLVGFFTPEGISPQTMAGSIAMIILSRGYNVFFDLLLCLLFFFFINYRPKKFFKGKLLILFRLGALVIFGYEIFCVVMKLWSAIDFEFVFPPLLLPWISSKPVATFVSFVAVCLYMKHRERRYYKEGGTEEGYDAFLLTRSNTFAVSRFVSITFALAAILDVILAVLLAVFLLSRSAQEAGASGAAADEYAETWLDYFASAVTNAGIGTGASLILISPLALLFSYTKQHDNKGIDRLIPVGGLALFGVVMIEGMYYVLSALLRKVQAGG